MWKTSLRFEVQPAQRGRVRTHRAHDLAALDADELTLGRGDHRRILGCSMSGTLKISKIHRMSPQKYVLPPTVWQFLLFDSRRAREVDVI